MLSEQTFWFLIKILKMLLLRIHKHMYVLLDISIQKHSRLCHSEKIWKEKKFEKTNINRRIFHAFLEFYLNNINIFLYILGCSLIVCKLKERNQSYSGESHYHHHYSPRCRPVWDSQANLVSFDQFFLNTLPTGTWMIMIRNFLLTFSHFISMSCIAEPREAKME